MDEDVRRLAAEGFTPKSIAHLLGRNEQVIRRKLNQLGISLNDLNIEWHHPFNQDSFKLRSGLGSVIVDMTSQNLLSGEISRLTGLNEREIGLAKNYPYHHDWTLSQIERTVSAAGKTIHDFI